jgi:hypothetical protein
MPPWRSDFLLTIQFRWDDESSTTEVPTEMVQTPLALVKAFMDMQMVSTHAPGCTCSHTPPEDLSEATSTDLCSPTPCPPFATNRPLTYNMIGFPSPPSAICSSSSPESHASNHLSRSVFMTRIVADPEEPWKDVSDYQTQLDPQGLTCTNHYEDASGKPLFTHNSQFNLS